MNNQFPFIEQDIKVDALFKQYYPRLCAYAARFVGKEPGQDLVMDCFVRLWEKRYTLKEDSWSSLLFVMVRNSCLNHLKRRKISSFEDLDYLSNLAGAERLYHFDFHYSGEDIMLYKELQEQIDIVLESLPPTCRSVFRKSRFEGKKNKEIAEEMNTSVKNIEKHITKALAAFTVYFKKKYPVDLLLLIIGIITISF